VDSSLSSAHSGKLTIYDEGQAFTESEYRDGLTAAGFLDIHVQFGVAPSGASFMSARKA
jgi:hypothetical protein